MAGSRGGTRQGGPPTGGSEEEARGTRGFTGATPGTSLSCHDRRRLAQQAPLEKMLGERNNPWGTGRAIHVGGRESTQLGLGKSRVEQPEMAETRQNEGHQVSTDHLRRIDPNRTAARGILVGLVIRIPRIMVMIAILMTKRMLLRIGIAMVIWFSGNSSRA